MIPKIPLIRNPISDFKCVTFRFIPECSMLCDMQMIKAIELLLIPKVEFFVNIYEVDSDLTIENYNLEDKESQLTFRNKLQENYRKQSVDPGSFSFPIPFCTQFYLTVDKSLDKNYKYCIKYWLQLELSKGKLIQRKI